MVWFGYPHDIVYLFCTQREETIGKKNDGEEEERV
jgi:hypothetical protein